MSYIPSSKFGSCTQCGAKSVPCVKIGKVLICCVCNRNNKNGVQISKAKKRDAERENAIKNLKPKEKRTLKRQIKNTVRGLGGETNNRSMLLQRADKVFGDFIKRRDADANGFITDPCNGQKYHLDAVDDNGDKIVNVLHYVERGCYALRFDEDNCHAGSSFSNLSMHLHKGGEAEQNYRKFLVNKLGEVAVLEMEAQKRRLHKLDNSQLKLIIEHYSQTN